MRSIALLTAVTGAFVLASACSDGGGTPPPDNTAPVANFALPACTLDQACNFASTSTDDVEVTEWEWDFDGDGDADATTANAAFTYRAAGDFAVSLTVSDAEGLSQTKTSTITIAPVEPPEEPPTEPENTPPTAGFTHECDETTCSFTSTSTDAAPGTIAAHAWTFGDGATADVSNPSHTYTITEPQDFTVTLTVTDDEGASDVETQTISVAPPPTPNTPPTAGFTHTCTEANCTFTSTSTDVAPGTIATHAWDFGDGATGDGAAPTHRYAVVNPTNFTVTLTVTDNEGATDVETKTITVTPPAPGSEGCSIVQVTRLDCRFDVGARSTIKLKLLGVSCDLQSQRVVIPPPSADQVFLGVCNRAVGDSTRIFGGPGDSAFIYEAGSQLVIRLVQGTSAPSEPPPGPPAGQITGSFPNWVVSFEDGANAGAPGEPDFTDIVVQVEAVPAP